MDERNQIFWFLNTGVKHYVDLNVINLMVVTVVVMNHTRLLRLMRYLNLGNHQITNYRCHVTYVVNFL